jgi:hypothetical protein
MKPLDLIDEHLIIRIRETVDYEFLNNVELVDIPEIMGFLKIVYNYKKINNLTKLTNEQK